MSGSEIEVDLFVPIIIAGFLVAVFYNVTKINDCRLLADARQIKEHSGSLLGELCFRSFTTGRSVQQKECLNAYR